MKTKFFLAAFLALAAVCLPNYASAGVPEAVVYLKSQPPDAWITMALAAAGETNVSTSHLTSVTETSYPTTDYAKTILALAAAGKNPTTFGNIDYVAKLKTYYNNNQMGSDALLNDDIWSILAFASIKKAGSIEALAAKNFLLFKQNADGGWGYSVGGASDSNDTAIAIIALVEVGISASDQVIVKALDYLHSLQNTDGGFPYNIDPVWGSASDASSDAWVISAIYKLSQDPEAEAWTKSGHNSVEHLNSLQTENGYFEYQPGSGEDGFSPVTTSYAVIALAGKSFPVGYYDIPPATRLTVNKSTLNSGESVVITVEYFDDTSWLALAGATVSGLEQTHLTDSLGQASTTLSVGDYSLSAVKEGFVASDQVKISVLAPTPAPAPVSNSGGSIILTTPTSCQSVEYDIWQNTCADNWQYRNVLIIAPVNCTLTAEQENERKRICVVLEPEADENIELEPEVLGVKIASSSAEQLIGVAVEANEIISGQASDFITMGTDSTIALGAGERAGVLNSYKSSFGKEPQTQDEWEDIIRISNNLLPLITGTTAEERARVEFKKIYGREADMVNLNNQAAINIIAYGLRPDKRNLDSERAGIRRFVEIYKYLPVSALDWDTVRAVAYSGVSL